MIKEQIGVGSLDISEKEKKYLLAVIDSNRLSYGKFSRLFENSFANHHDSKYAIFCNSGTSALQIALATLKEVHGWDDGDEVLVPALTFIASSNIVLQNNMKPVFVDVHPNYYNIDPARIEERITPKTKAIVVVHLCGQPCDMDPILAIAKKHNLKIIEDSCETMFARYKGRPVGSFGDIACFSTYACHIIVTGVGGLAMTNDKNYAVILRSIANHGRDSIYMSMDDDKGKGSEELKTIMSRRFSFIRMGYSFRATEMEAAIGLGQLERKDEIVKKRKENAAFLINNLKKWEKYIQLPAILPYAEHVFMFFPIVVKDNRIKRDDLTLFLEKNLIETRSLLPLLNQPFYMKIFGDIDDEYPVAKNIRENGFYIGCQPQLKQEELEYMVQKFDDFFRRLEK